jgi:hypothetical protein
MRDGDTISCDFNCGETIDVSGLLHPFALLYTQEWDWFRKADGSCFYCCGGCRDDRSDEFHALRKAHAQAGG